MLQKECCFLVDMPFHVTNIFISPSGRWLVVQTSILKIILIYDILLLKNQQLETRGQYISPIISITATSLAFIPNTDTLVIASCILFFPLYIYFILFYINIIYY